MTRIINAGVVHNGTNMADEISRAVADGIFLWEAVPVKDGSIGKRLELVTKIMGEGGGE